MPARDLLRMIAEATHQCGDPGMQFDTTINEWHTCPNTGRINASNPCSEYMHLDDSACNLASLNLMQFVEPNGAFDVAGLPPRRRRRDHGAGHRRRQARAIRRRRSRPTRTPTASSASATRTWARCSCRSGCPTTPRRGASTRAPSPPSCAARRTSSRRVLAERARAVRGIRRRTATRSCASSRSTAAHAYKLDSSLVPLDLLAAAARRLGRRPRARHATHGVRNSQVTVLAPTGTIAFMMDCDTTGVEPDIALVKYKKLVGGGPCR